MYKIKVTAQRGKGKIRRMESAENYTTAEAVADFIEKSIERQYLLCAKGWGIVAQYEHVKNDVKTVDFFPVSPLLGSGLRLTFRVIEI